VPTSNSTNTTSPVYADRLFVVRGFLAVRSLVMTGPGLDPGRGSGGLFLVDGGILELGSGVLMYGGAADTGGLGHVQAGGTLTVLLGAVLRQGTARAGGGGLVSLTGAGSVASFGDDEAGASNDEEAEAIRLARQATPVDF